MKALQLIQSALKVPKKNRNTFGNYNYRNAEDILEALKPLLEKHGCNLTISDEIVMIGERYYVKSTVRLSDCNESIETVAYARETLTKKGMDDAQLTGATSSYARKYGLNGMFCIDDTKDADSMDNSQQNKNTQKDLSPITEKQHKMLEAEINSREIDREGLKKFYGIVHMDKIPKSSFNEILNAVKSKPKK